MLERDPMQGNGGEHPYAERMESYVGKARSEVDDFDQRARALVRERPFVALAVALAAGYFLARTVAR